MSTVLTPQHEKLLREVLQKRMVSGPLRQELLERVKSNALTSEDADVLCDVLLKEFTSTGLRADSEPTARGHKLEELVDLIRKLGK